MRRSGKFAGSEAERLTALKYAAMLGAAYVDVELKAAAFFFAGEPCSPSRLNPGARALSQRAPVADASTGRAAALCPRP